MELTTGIEYFYDSLHGVDQRDWRGQRRWGGEGGLAQLAGELESTSKKISSRNSLLLSIKHTTKNKYRKLVTNIPRKELHGHTLNFHIHVSCERLLFSHDRSA